METKHVDLVIKDEADMILLITLVIQSINTRNNYKGTAQSSIAKAYSQERNQYYQQVLQKYKWMKWRAKISFMAFV
jgi:hypothetical protein